MLIHASFLIPIVHVVLSRVEVLECIMDVSWNTGYSSLYAFGYATPPSHGS